MIRRRVLALAMTAALAVSASLPGASAEEQYPSRIIRLVIPNPSGGPGDVVARFFAEKASQSLGQQIVFDYRPGASTTLGTQTVVKAEPDGYTILGFPSSGLTTSLLRKDMPYNLESDLRPVIGMGSIPMALVVRADSPFKTFDDLARATREGDLTYGTAGPGTLAHLSTAQFLNEVKGKATHVPFRGNPEVINAVMGGHIDFFFGSANAVLGGQSVRVLAVTAHERLPELPDVPTTSELGLSNFNPKLWYAIMVPSQTPDAIVTRLYDAFAEAGKDPAVVEQLSSAGVLVELQDPPGVSAMMKEEAVRWKKVIEVNNITVGD